MTSRAQRAARWPRPPLLAAHLPGIVTTHTLGHPTDSHALEDVPAAHCVASAVPSGTPSDGEPHHAGPAVSAIPTGPVPPLPGGGPVGSRDTAPLGGAVRIPVRSV